MKTLCIVFCTLVIYLTHTNGGLIPDNVLHGLLNAPAQLDKTVNTAVNNAIAFKDSEEDERPAYLNPPQVSTTTVAVTSPRTTTVASVNGTATEKDGRENFAGGCSTGFKRTPDGRCMPTV